MSDSNNYNKENEYDNSLGKHYQSNMNECEEEDMGYNNSLAKHYGGQKKKSKGSSYISDYNSTDKLEDRIDIVKSEPTKSKKSFKVSNFIKTFLSKFAITWKGRKDYLALTKEESQYEYEKIDNFFIDSLKQDVIKAKEMLDNGYIIPSKLNKALLNEIFLNDVWMMNELKDMCFKNSLFDYENNSTEREQLAKRISKFYCENKLGTEVFFNDVLLTSEEYIFCKKYIWDNLLKANYEDFPIIKLIYQAVESSNPEIIWKKYKEKQIGVEVMGLIAVKYKNEFKAYFDEDFIKDVESYLERVFNGQFKYTEFVTPEFKDSSSKEENLLIELKKLSFEEYNKKASKLLNELKGTNLNNAIKNRNYCIVGKEFNSDQINVLLEKFENLVGELNKKELSIDIVSVKLTIERNIEDILINNLLLKDLQGEDFSVDDLKEQIDINIKELSNIYEKEVNKEMIVLKNDLKVKKRTMR